MQFDHLSLSRLRKATPITDSGAQRRQESSACVIVMMPLPERSTVHNFAETPIASDVPRARVPTRESLVVLTRDKALVETLRALGSEHNIVIVAGESDLAGELVGKNMGVAIIDAASLASPV